ncbi:hypothetical protein AAFN86_17005 [Roseomonas sp. CAU 1739]|uniref:hypothetical protein n=1 Tax=Roseomonas sp. CAU 1739 TaxID=3140364 RepID=UPI00325AF6CA
MFILIGIWSLTMAATGLAIFDLTGNVAAAYAAAALPLLFAVSGLMPNGAWALPALAIAWALTARVLPPGHAAPRAPMAVAGSQVAG